MVALGYMFVIAITALAVFSLAHAVAALRRGRKKRAKFFAACAVPMIVSATGFLWLFLLHYHRWSMLFVSAFVLAMLPFNRYRERLGQDVRDEDKGVPGAA